MTTEIIVHNVIADAVRTVKLIICKIRHTRIGCTADHVIFNGIVAPLFVFDAKGAISDRENGIGFVKKRSAHCAVFVGNEHNAFMIDGIPLPKRSEGTGAIKSIKIDWHTKHIKSQVCHGGRPAGPTAVAVRVYFFLLNSASIAASSLLPMAPRPAAGVVARPKIVLANTKLSSLVTSLTALAGS